MPAATGILLRFISCGMLSLGAGAIWLLGRPRQRIGVAGALADILILLSGFIAGGLLWYLRDARVRSRRPEHLSEERLAFSFVVFALVPFAVLLLVGAVWLLTLLLGAG